VNNAEWCEPVWHFQKGSWRNPPISFLIFRDDPSSRLVRFLAKLELFVAQDDAFDQTDTDQERKQRAATVAYEGQRQTGRRHQV
jgi:hypothetical protein